MRFLATTVLASTLAACAASAPSTPGAPVAQESFPGYFGDVERERARLDSWRPGQILAQGFLGVGYPDELEFDSGSGSVEIDADELDSLPVIGGGLQMKLAGDRLDFGVEGMLSFSFRSDLVAFRSSGGSGTIAVDVDVLVFDLFGGPFLSAKLGRRARVYAAAGPIMRFLEYSEEDDDTDEESSGFGAGVYARGGIEFQIPSGTLVGFGTRWSRADVDLDSGFGDAQYEDFQALITVTRGW